MTVPLSRLGRSSSRSARIGTRPHALESSHYIGEAADMAPKDSPPWHRWLGIALADTLVDQPYRVSLEEELALRKALVILSPTSAGECVVRPSWPDRIRAGSPDYAAIARRWTKR